MAIAQFSGLASGIDSQTLIDAYIEAIQRKNEIRKAQVTELSDQTDTLTEFKDKLRSLNDLVDKFRTANAGGLAKKASSSDSTVASAVVSSSANNSSYSLTVTSLANTATGSFDTSYASASSTISGGSGFIEIVVGTGSNQVTINKNITSSTTLQDFVNDFNADSSASGKVVASAINIGSEATPDYRLVFTTLQSGTDEGFLNLGTDVGELSTTTVEQATDAEFSIGGIGTSITRSTNTISDIISGVTLSLTDTGTATISISNDADKTSSQIQEVVDAYNEIVSFIAENNIVERVESSSGASNIFGKLAKTTVDDQFLSMFRNEIATSSSSIGTAVTRLAEMGVTTNRFDGSLTFDEDDFKNAVSSDPQGVNDVLNTFADNVAGVSGVIYEFTKTAGFIDNTIESNNSQIERLSEAINQLDRRTDKIKDRLTRQFANLESVTARLQSQQQQLTGLLANLGR